MLVCKSNTDSLYSIVTEAYDGDYFVDLDHMVQIANESFNPDCDEYYVTKEGAIGDFFKNIIEKIKSFFAKVRDFFKKIFTKNKESTNSSSPTHIAIKTTVEELEDILNDKSLSQDNIRAISTMKITLDYAIPMNFKSLSTQINIMATQTHQCVGELTKIAKNFCSDTETYTNSSGDVVTRDNSHILNESKRKKCLEDMQDTMDKYASSFETRGADGKISKDDVLKKLGVFPESKERDVSLSSLIQELRGTADRGSTLTETYSNVVKNTNAAESELVATVSKIKNDWKDDKRDYVISAVQKLSQYSMNMTDICVQISSTMSSTIATYNKCLNTAATAFKKKYAEIKK